MLRLAADRFAHLTPRLASRFLLAALLLAMAVVVRPAPVAAQDENNPDPVQAAAAQTADRIVSLVAHEDWARDRMVAYTQRLTENLLADLDNDLAIVLFNAMEAQTQWLPDPDAAMKPIDGIDLEGLANGWNARSLRLRRVQRLQMQGQRDDAMAEFRKTPLVRQAATLGPLAWPDEAALSLPLPPDGMQDPLGGSPSFTAANGDAKQWERVELDERRFQRFFGDRYFWEQRGKGSGHYLATQVVVSGMMPRPVMLRVYGSRAFRLSINGDVLGTFDHRRDVLPHNTMLSLSLSPGRHVIMIKHLMPEMQSVELSDGNGRIPEGVKVDLDADGALGVAKLVKPGWQSWGWQLACIELAEKAPDNANANYLASMARLGQGLTDVAWNLAKRAYQLKKTPLTCWWLAEVQGQHRDLPEATRVREAKALYQEALELDPQFAPAIYALADDALASDQPDEAKQFYDRVLEFSPDSLHALLARRDIYRSKRLTHLDHQLMKQLRSVAPSHPAVRSYFIDWYRGLPDLRAAGELLADQLERNPGDADAAMQLVRIAEQLGADPADLTDRWNQLRQQFYDNDEVLRGAAAWFERIREWRQAIECVEMLIDREPNQTTAHREWIARLAFAADDHARGERELQQALDNDGDRHDLRRYLAHRQGVNLYAFADKHKPDVDKLIESAPDADDYPRAMSVILHRSQVLRVFNDGSYVGVVSLVRKIMTHEGVTAHGVVGTGGELLEARVILPDGTEYEPTATGGGGLQMPRLEPGSVQAVRYRIESGAPADGRLRIPRFWFGDTERRAPILHSKFVLLLPMHITDEPRSWMAPAAREGFDGFDRMMTWEMRNVMPDDVQEPYEPDLDELIPWVEIRPLQTWTSVYASLLNRGTPWNRITSVVREKAELLKTLVEDPTDIEALTRAAYAEVNNVVKEDGWGEGPTATLLTGRGNRQELFLALLSALGIKTTEVWAAPAAREQMRSPVDTGEPRPGLYSMPFIIVHRADGDDRDDIVLSLSERLLPFGMIPSHFAGSIALKADPDTGCGFVTLAGPEPFADARRTNLRFKVHSDGSADVEGRFSAHGVEGAQLNERFKRVPDFQKRQQANGLAASLCGPIDLSDYSFTNPEADPDLPGTPFVATFTGKVERFAQIGRSEMQIRGGPRPMDFVGVLAPTASREHDIVLAVGPVAMIDRIEYEVDSDVRIVQLPEPIARHNESVSYQRTVIRDGQTIIVERKVLIRPVRLPKAAWSRLLRFCQELDQHETAMIRLAR